MIEIKCPGCNEYHTGTEAYCSKCGDTTQVIDMQEHLEEVVSPDFIAIDFETANSKRVSACSLGFAKVSDGMVIETDGFLIKPVGGHAPFQSKIHGIKDDHTYDKPEFGELFPKIEEIFDYPLVGHSLFDKQVLNSLSDHFGLGLNYEYVDSCSIAKEKLPNLKNHKLKTLVKHFNLPAFKHHDAQEDAKACAQIFLKLQQDNEEPLQPISLEDFFEFKGLVKGILADDEVNYKEAYELLYWLEDHSEFAQQHHELYKTTREVLADDYLDDVEADIVKDMLKDALENC